MKTSTARVVGVPSFPEHAIRSALTKWWHQQIADRTNDPFTPTSQSGTLFELLPAIDSLTTMDALLVTQSIVGYEIPVKFVKKGGYQSPEEMISDLLPKIRKLHIQK